MAELKNGYMVRRKVGDRHCYFRGNSAHIKWEYAFNKAKMFTKAEYAQKLIDKIKKEADNLEVVYLDITIRTVHDIIEEEMLS